MNITDWKTKLTGFGCDGVSANMAEGGLRGLLRRELLPLICMLWCLAHRLELAVKNALNSQFKQSSPRRGDLRSKSNRVDYQDKAVPDYVHNRMTTFVHAFK